MKKMGTAAIRLLFLFLLVSMLSTFGLTVKSPFSVATILTFDGTQYVRIMLPKKSKTEAEDISLRFR